MCMYMYIYVCMYVYVYVYMYVYVCMCKREVIYLFIHPPIHPSTNYIHIYV
jgi:hypothetical protein